MAFRNKGDLDHAIADYTQVIALDPKNAGAYFSRGRVALLKSSLPMALADLNQATALAPSNAYAALWLDIANRRSNLPSRLADAAKQIDMTKWPAPVIRLYIGQLTPEAVLAAANDPNADTKKRQVCEANFHTGEFDLQQGKKDDAMRLFRLATVGCPESLISTEGATAELKALGATP
jgi:lipoprotein NlpI